MYDANGNQITRHIGGDTFNLAYDAENRLVEVKKNDSVIAQFVYDGDGKRVMSMSDNETILFIGGHYEVKGSEITKYYFAGATRIAMRKYVIPQSMGVEYLLGDHLGSTSLTTDSAGEKVSEMRYKPFGEARYSWTSETLTTTPTYEMTKYQFTGQFSYEAEFGLLFYNARMYDPALGRFTSADTIVPAGVQGLDRYAYVSNNPVKLIDPSGHKCVGEAEECEDNGNPINGAGQSGSGNSRGTGSEITLIISEESTLIRSIMEIWNAFNWSVDTPEHLTLYQTTAFPFLTGYRIYGDASYTIDNGSNTTISSNTGSITSGNFEISPSGAVFQTGTSSIYAASSYLGMGFGGTLSPWGFDVSANFDYQNGNSIYSYELGAEFVARPDNTTLVAAPVLLYAAVNSWPLIVPLLPKIPQILNTAPKSCPGCSQ